MHMDPPPEGAGPARRRQDRDAADVRLLCSLAAAHLLFGRFDAAASFIAFARWIVPDHPRALELGAMIDMRRGRLADALAAVVRLRDSGRDVVPELAMIELRATARGIV